MSRRPARPASGPKQWTGAAVAKARARIGATLPQPCGRCGHAVLPEHEWVVGHIKSRAAYPELTFEPSNQRPEHRRCSDKSAQHAVQEKAERQGYERALRELSGAQSSWGAPTTGTAGPPFPSPVEPRTSRMAPRSPSEASVSPGSTLDTLGSAEWLRSVLEVPDDAAPPLAMSPPHPRAVMSYGVEAIEWIEREVTPLRWWQKLCLLRLLEADENGDLVWRTSVVSASRRSGKSVLLLSLALWRMSRANTHPFGEDQLVLHVARDMSIVNEVMRGAWRWAEDKGWKVYRANGKEAIETDGARWLGRAVQAAYGYSVGLALVDEGWDISERAYDEGIEPAMLERINPQAVLTSTAHRRATQLMKSNIKACLSEIETGLTDDSDTLLLLWGAPKGADPGLEETWRAASPHWTEDRRKMLRSKYERALSGEADPDADEPDAMIAFASQYCNTWDLGLRREAPGHPLVGDEQWHSLAASIPNRPPDAIAIEGWYSEPIAMVKAWREEETVVLAASEHGSVAEAVSAAAAAGCVGQARVGKSLTADPAFAGLWHEPAQGTTIQAVSELSRLLAEWSIAHDGSDLLADQVLAVRTQASSSGPRLTSKRPAHFIKAAVWAAEAARETLAAPLIW